MTGPQITTSLRTVLIRAEEERDRYRSRIEEMEALITQTRGVLSFLDRKGLAADRPASGRTSVAGVFRRGEVYARCIKALEDTQGDLSTRQLAEICMAARGLDASDSTQRLAMLQTVITTLHNHANKQEIFSPRKVGRMKLWRLRER